MRSLHVLPVSVCVSSGCSSFPLQSKVIHRLIIQSVSLTKRSDEGALNVIPRRCIVPTAPEKNNTLHPLKASSSKRFFFLTTRDGCIFGVYRNLIC